MASGSPTSIEIGSLPFGADRALEEKIAFVTIGDSAASVGEFDIILSSGDSGATPGEGSTGLELFYLPNLTYVVQLGWQVTEAWPAGNIFQFGDCDDPNGWGDSLLVGSTTVDTDIQWTDKSFLQNDTGITETSSDVSIISSDLHPAYIGGKLYNDTLAADTLAIQMTMINVAASGFATGAMTVYIKYFRAPGRKRQFRQALA